MRTSDVTTDAKLPVALSWLMLPLNGGSIHEPRRGRAEADFDAIATAAQWNRISPFRGVTALAARELEQLQNLSPLPP